MTQATAWMRSRQGGLAALVAALALAGAEHADAGNRLDMRIDERGSKVTATFTPKKRPVEYSIRLERRAYRGRVRGSRSRRPQRDPQPPGGPEIRPQRPAGTRSLPRRQGGQGRPSLQCRLAAPAGRHRRRPARCTRACHSAARTKAKPGPPPARSATRGDARQARRSEGEDQASPRHQPAVSPGRARPLPDRSHGDARGHGRLAHRGLTAAGGVKAGDKGGRLRGHDSARLDDPGRPDRRADLWREHRGLVPDRLPERPGGRSST